MPQITAKELQSVDPAKFQREYLSWREYALDYDWWDYMEESFKARMQAKGYEVTRIHFSLSYSQGDYASFDGRANVAEWMEAHTDGDQTYAEKYPALYLAEQDYGEHATMYSRSDRSCWPTVSLDGYCIGNTYSAGVFSGLDSEAWDELVEEQFSDANLEHAMQEDANAECRQLYRDLQSEYEHLTSEESFIESCECNDITFEIEDEECEA